MNEQACDLDLFYLLKCTKKKAFRQDNATSTSVKNRETVQKYNL